MAINISTLNATEVTFIRRDNPLQEYNSSKLANADLKGKLNEAISQGKVSNLLEASGIDTLSITANPDGPRRNTANYSVDAFFRKDMPKIQNGDGTYTIDKVKFTEDELLQARNFMKAATSELKTSGTLDYSDYAKMAIAENSVNSFAKDNFSEEQQKVIAKAMKEFNEGVEEEQKKSLSYGDVVDNDWGELSKYYGKSNRLSQSMADSINELKKEMGRLTRRELPQVKEGDVLGIIVTATNTDLISKVKDTFDDLDFNNSEDVDSAMKKYRDLMRPAYKAGGYIERDDSALFRDTDSFMKMIKNLKLSLSSAHVNCSV